MADSERRQGDTNAATGRLVATAAIAVLLFAVALVTRTGIVGLAPIYDELYHLIPAVSLQETGTFAILDGSYERASIYTRLVSLAFDLAGARDMAAARLIPSAIPGALLVVAMTVWTWRVAGTAAAAIVLLFLLLWPNGIEVSQYVRFYAVHGLATLCAMLCIYEVLTRPGGLPRTAVLLGVAAILLLFALRIQQTTLITAAAAGLWVALVFGPAWLRRHRWLRWAVLAGIAAVGLVLASGVLNDTLARLWTTYRWEPWPVLRDTTFYHRDFRDNYATFWSLFPFAALIALRARFVPASFCLALFATSFVLQSFGGLKNIRYLYPTMPFFFAIWGIALAHVGGILLRYFRTTAAELLPPAAGPRPAAAFAVLCVAAATLFTAFSNNAVRTSLRLVTGAESAFLLGKERLQWHAVDELAAPWLERGAIVVTTEEMLAVRWLGDYDFALNKPRFSEMLYSLGPDTRPFVEDFRSGRPIAGEIEDFRSLVACTPVGIVLSHDSWIDSTDARIFGRMAEEEGAETTRAARGDASILAWAHPAGARPASDCAGVPAPRDPAAAETITSGQRQPVPISSASAER